MTDLAPTKVVSSREGEVADNCDECGEDIPFNVTCYMVSKGTSEDGLPLVSIVCAKCHD